jgi:hypothetical protein
LKKFTILCDFAGAKAPFNIYVGEPRPDKHPLQHQASWLSRERGGNVPSDVMDSLQKLLNIAKEEDVSFEELCVHELVDKEKTEGDGPDDTTVEPVEA